MLTQWSRLRDAVLQRWWRLAVPAWLRAHGVQVGSGLNAHGWPIVSGVLGAQRSAAAGAAPGGGAAPGAGVPSAAVPTETSGRITLGQRVTLCSVARFTALGCAQPVMLRLLRPGAVIDIGDDSGLSGTVICAAQAVHIGRECLIGANVMIFDTDFHPLHPEGRRFNDDPGAVGCAPVHIGDRVFIGAGSMVCKGVRIGDGAVIGAGSVVTRDVPAGQVAAGNPARALRRPGSEPT